MAKQTVKLSGRPKNLQKTNNNNAYLRAQYQRLRGQLLTERSTFLSHWDQLSRFIQPRRARFFTSDVDRGNRRNQSIIDSTASLAIRTLQSGMMSGITSPARPWFQLTTPDPEMMKYEPVKDWLYDVSQRMAYVFLKSNLYNSLPTVYGDMGGFATAAMNVEEDFEHVIRTYPFAVGSYYLANDARLKVRLFMRDFRLTIRQIVEKFARDPMTNQVDWSNVSKMVKTQWDAGNTEAWWEVSHVVLPNENWDPNKMGSQFKRYRSVYWERGSTINSDSNNMVIGDGKVLSDKGYDYFPILCPRWEITGEDVYGTNCPAMLALGDIMGLQVMVRRGMQALEKMINPPMVAPSALRTQKSTILPGDVTYLDTRDGQQGFSPAFQINPNFKELNMQEETIRQRVRKCFFEDLFLMMSQNDQADITAREINERHEEKLLALGPVLEQLNQDFLDPLIEITFAIMQKQRLIPPPPDELQGVPLRVEYISVMAQAQKLIGIAGLERFAGFVGQMRTATEDPSILDKIDTDALIEKYGDATAVPPGIVREQDQVDQIRQQRQQAQQQQQQAEQAQQASAAAANLSKADMSKDNALTRLAAAGQAGNPIPQQ